MPNFDDMTAREVVFYILFYPNILWLFVGILVGVWWRSRDRS